MKDLHIALAQGRWTGDQASTQALYRELVAQAAATGAELVCLPEFTILPYFPGVRDRAGFRWAEPIPGGVSERFFSELAGRHGVFLIGSLFERDAAGDYWDTATLHDPAGRLKGLTRKVHIPSGDGYHETDYFAGAGQYPVHDIGALKLAAPTCYDQWFPELARIYALEGAEFIFYPTAIGSEPTAPDFDSAAAWQLVMRGHAVANGVFIAACNRTGHENAVTFYGSSFICDPLGNVLAQASRDSDQVIDAVLRADMREQYLALFPLMHQRKPQHYGRLLQAAAHKPPPRWAGQLAKERAN
ncbi:MAG: hydrolase [Chloroflexi bacterium]|nr:hydrolase [Chloroflexota bacterium]MCY3581701.1 hydrolase [Chloroflexota bacterium]MCY3714984.1 hydrolase [Chloroflexota bacterium]MDE2651844.1 hydrolase [Chloroflexota bacterium]MXV93799.1 hydrolase [Chloroflexota bacterium]